MKIGTSIANVSARGLRIFVRSPFSSATAAWVFLLAIVFSIWFADYLTSVELSLSIFYLIPISLCAGWFGYRSGTILSAVVTALRLSADVVETRPEYLPGHVWWNVSAAFVIFVFVVWLVDSLVTAHHLLEGRVAARTSELAESEADRRRLEMEVLEVTARERATIGRELHDELGQHLVATALAAQVLAQQLGTEKGGQEAHAIVGWIEQAIAKTRKLARGLLLARIENDRFIGELEELAANASQGGVRCQVVHEGEHITASAGECAQLFRIAQEAIGNALRHGRPHEIDITVATDAQATCLIVTDDGAGFRPVEGSAGMGLRIMQHRAQIIGASLAVLSTPGEGTRVVCRLPTSSSTAP